jgi:hypothetical protein
MTTRIGPTFASELAAAGLAGLPICWSDDGTVEYGAAMTADQIAAAEAVLAAHDPTKPLPPPPPTPLQWMMRLAQATQLGLVTAARSDAAVDLALRYASGVSAIDVADPMTQQNVQMLQGKGLLTADEAAALLTP